MTDFNYHLEIDSAPNKFKYLIVRLEGKVPLTQMRVNSYPDLQEKQLLQWLMKEEMRALKISSLSPSHTLTQFRVSSEHSWEAIKRLSLTRRLYWDHKRILFDPFSQVTFGMELKEQTQGNWILSGVLISKDHRIPISDVSVLFQSDPPWFILRGVIQRLSDEVDGKWIERVFPQPQMLDPDSFRALIREYEEEESAYAPNLQWNSPKPSALDVLAQPLPFLKLRDRSGAFADLWFDYGALGKVSIDDPKPHAWRNRVAEKGWEKDLLETDYILKMVDSTRYYCPMDRVAKSLTFLLEIGWKIYDHQEREVVRQRRSDVEVSLENQVISVKGKVNYDEHEADLSDVMGAFMRREQFLQLSPSAVALIDRAAVDQEWGVLAGKEVVGNAFVLKRNQAGLLSSFFAKGVKAPPPLIDWNRRLQGELSFEPAPPSSLFQGTLLDYQQKGVDWLHFLSTWGFSGLLADEMGLGKTVQILAFFSRLSQAKPSLVVMPTSLLFNWKREAEKFLPGIVPYIHTGTKRVEDVSFLQEQKLIFTSYALLRQDQDLFQSIDYELVVLDEGQNIKNPDSQVAQAVFQLRSQIRLVASGTPIENRWEDLWSLFHFLMPDLLGERREFTGKMAAAALDPRYLQQTQAKVRPFLLRRRKEDVAQDLPEKITQVVWIEMNDAQRSLYEEWVRNHSLGLLKKIEKEGTSAHRMQILEAILRLRQLCAHPLLVESESQVASAKLERLLEDVSEVLAEKRKVLIYSQFTQMLQLIEQELKERNISYVTLDGSTKDRETPVRQFQEDPNIQVFLISLKAGGVGLNLTAADYVFLYDPWWNEAAESQAIDRAHRFGRKGAVIARRYITAYTIEEKLMRLKEHKRALSEGILEGADELSALTMDDLRALLC